MVPNLITTIRDFDTMNYITESFATRLGLERISG